MNAHRPPSRYHIRPARAEDAAGIKRIIHTVMPEFGAVGPGFAIVDPEVEDMPAAYARPGCAYYVIVSLDDDATPLAGAGVAPLDHSPDPHVCELRKMYAYGHIRGQGLGDALLRACLQQAKALGYTRCYLETLARMEGARKLYTRHGFEPLSQRMGDTGHGGCDMYYLLELERWPLT